MRWKNVQLIFGREVRDQLRDRRTLFTVAVLPLLLYPLLGVSFMQMSQFLREQTIRVRFVGERSLPARPPLLVGETFSAEFCDERERRLFDLTFDSPAAGGEDAESLDELVQRARQDIHAGRYDALVYVPADLNVRVAESRSAASGTGAAPNDEAPNAATSDGESPRETAGTPQHATLIVANSAADRSRMASRRVERVLSRWRESTVSASLQARGVPPAATNPFTIEEVDVSEEVSRRAALWSKVLPFVAFVWALTGAFYPAIDLCAGEKERGTLETLLCSPALRSEIVWGKLLTTMTFSIATALLNLACISVTGALFVRQLEMNPTLATSLHIGVPPVWALGWLLLALLPLAGLFGALSLAIASFARSSREGQYYLMPLLMICLPLMLLPMLPSVELDLGTSLVPLTGVMLLMRALIEGQYAEALAYFPPVAVVTCGCCWLAIRWAIDQFNNESVLFRESERWDIRRSLATMFEQRGDTPTVGQAVFCGVLLLLSRFFAPLLLGQSVQDWSGFVQTTIVLQVGLIGLPPLVLALALTRRPRETFLLTKPSLSAVLGAIMLAITLHPVGFAIGNLVRQIYPVSGEILGQLEAVEGVLRQAPGTWAVLLLLAVVPAVCEELAFRGFILSGLRRSGRPWVAIGMSSFFFGAVHSILQQSIGAFLIGVVIGFLAVRTRSIATTMTFHIVYNSLALLLGMNFREILEKNPSLSKLIQESPFGVEYQPSVAFVSASVSGILLIWFNNLPAPKSRDELLRQAQDESPAAPPAEQS